jgi:hypothetical protein
MSYRILAASCLIVLIPNLALAQSGGVFSPTSGVLCDRNSSFCADDTGISASWTERYLGAAAAKKLAGIIGGDGDFDGTIFTMSNGVHCELAARVCTKSKFGDEIEPTATKALFGRMPPTAKPNAAITFPSKGVICDKASGMCVDREGISMALTKEYLGGAAEAKLMQLVRENPDMDLTSYVLVNGVDCDSKKQRCMTERRGSDVERRYTKHLFGN